MSRSQYRFELEDNHPLELFNQLGRIYFYWGTEVSTRDFSSFEDAATAAAEKKTGLDSWDESKLTCSDKLSDWSEGSGFHGIRPTL